MTLPIFLIDKPWLPPFSCGRCNCTEGTREYWIDTGIDIEVASHADGRLYLCNMCVRDFVNADPNAFTKEDMDNIVAVTQDACDSAEKVVRKWKDQVIAFARIGINLETVWEKIGPEPERIVVRDPEPVSVDQPAIGPDIEIDRPEPNSNPLILANF